MNRWFTFGGVWIFGVGTGLLAAAGLMRWSTAKNPPEPAPIAWQVQPQFNVPSWAILTTPAADAPPLPEFANTNKNSLVEKYQARLIVTASSQDGDQWNPSKLIDQSIATSWFSTRGDTTTQNRQPWVKVAFPEDVRVRWIAMLGNRIMTWPGSFAVVTARLELLNDRDEVIYSEERTAANEHGDFEFALPQPVEGVRAVRFVSIADRGDQNTFQEIALSEMMID